MSNIIVFCILAVLILASAILTVTTRKTLRAVVCLLFVLLGMAGLYLLLNYHFLAMVQIAVYAGGIVVLFVFAVLLVNQSSDGKLSAPTLRRALIAGLSSLAGVAVVAFTFLKSQFLYSGNPTVVGDHEIPMKEIGRAMMGTDKHQYLLSFELVSILLLACAIGGILIARKR